MSGESDAGGFTFRQIAVAEHGDARQGLYESSLSNRFTYGYAIARGIYEIRYDPSGRIRFGSGTEGRTMGMPQRAPYTFRLPEDQAFLRCRD